MAQQFKHARYFRVRNINDSSLFTYASTDAFNTAVGLKSAYNTGSPTKTLSLEDGGKTLKIVFEFASQSNQDAFKSAVDSAWSDDGGPFRTGQKSDEQWHGDMTEHFKTEWYGQDGTTVQSTNEFGSWKP